MATTVETEVRAGMKTLRGAESAAARMNADETITGIRYSARPCSINPSRFVVVRTDGAAERVGDSLTRPDRKPRAVSKRDFVALSGKKSRSRERDTFNRRIFA